MKTSHVILIATCVALVAPGAQSWAQARPKGAAAKMARYPAVKIRSSLKRRELLAHAREGKVLLPYFIGGKTHLVPLSRDEFHDLVWDLYLDGQLKLDDVPGFIKSAYDASRREVAELVLVEETIGNGLPPQDRSIIAEAERIGAAVADYFVSAVTPPPPPGNTSGRPPAGLREEILDRYRTFVAGAREDIVKAAVEREIGNIADILGPAPRNRVVGGEARGTEIAGEGARRAPRPPARTGAIVGGPGVPFLPQGEAPRPPVFAPPPPPPLPPPPRVASGWSGIFSDGVSEYEVSGAGGVLTGQGKSSTARGEWSGCAVSGNTATCTFTGSYKDGDKQVSYSGTADLTLSGDTLSGTHTLAAVEFSWTPGVTPYESDSAFKVGAKFPFSLTRKR